MMRAVSERLWHYQTVHHDLWDRDLGSAPTLATVTDQGKERRCSASFKTRRTLFTRSRQRKTDFSDRRSANTRQPIPGEYASPTQPKVTLPEPFTRQAFTPT